MCNDIKINVFTTTKCPYCKKAMEMIKDVANKHKEIVWKQTSIDEFSGRKEAMNYGIPAVPAIAINGKLVFIGLPTEEEFTIEVENKLNPLILSSKTLKNWIILF